MHMKNDVETQTLRQEFQLSFTRLLKHPKPYVCTCKYRKAPDAHTAHADMAPEEARTTSDGTGRLHN